MQTKLLIPRCQEWWEQNPGWEHPSLSLPGSSCTVNEIVSVGFYCPKHRLTVLQWKKNKYGSFSPKAIIGKLFLLPGNTNPSSSLQQESQHTRFNLILITPPRNRAQKRPEGENSFLFSAFGTKTGFANCGISIEHQHEEVRSSRGFLCPSSPRLQSRNCSAADSGLNFSKVLPRDCATPPRHHLKLSPSRCLRS